MHSRTWIRAGRSRQAAWAFLLALVCALLAAAQLAIAAPRGDALVVVSMLGAALVCLWLDWRRHAARIARDAVVGIALPTRRPGGAPPGVAAGGDGRAPIELDADTADSAERQDAEARWRLLLRDGRELGASVDRVYLANPWCGCVRFRLAAARTRWARPTRVEFYFSDSMSAVMHRRLRQALLLGAALDSAAAHHRPVGSR